MSVDPSLFSDLIAIGERGRIRETDDDQTNEDILGYDERGLPI